jgi:hypothetical protein
VYPVVYFNVLVVAFGPAVEVPALHELTNSFKTLPKVQP